MSRQEQLTFFKLVLSKDLNDNLFASALSTVASEIIKVARSITFESNEQIAAQKISAAIAVLQKALAQEINSAMGAELANERRKTPEKSQGARNKYTLAVEAMRQPLEDIISAMEQLVKVN